MASKPKTPPAAGEEGGDEPLQLTSIGDKLIDLPDESIIDVPISDTLAAGEEDDAGGEGEQQQHRTPAAQPGGEQRRNDGGVVDDGESEQLAALRKRVEDNNAAAQERIRVAEQNAINERNARLHAEQQHREQQQRSQEESSQREMALLTQNIESTSAQLETLQDELARQNEAGEFKEAAKTQGKIARTAAALDRMENEKAAFEANAGQRRTPPHEGRVEQPGGTRQPPQQQTVSEQLDRWLGTLDPPAAKWIREHPECAPPNLGGTKSGYNKMMAGHYAAEAAGVETNSPEYFKMIEERTGHRKAETEPGSQPGGQRRQQPAGQRRAIPGAPPSREAPGGSHTPGRTRQVRLSKQQQEHALLSYPQLSPQAALAEYAKNLVELEAEGKMGRTNV